MPAHETTSSEGRTVVVIGGTRGIGRSVALSLAASGTTVIATGTNESSIAQLLAEADRRALSIATAIVDVSDVSAVRRTIDATADAYGRIDGLVASAGISPIFKRSEHVETDDWDKIAGINLRGTFFAVQSAGRRMLEAGRGSIVVISSVTGSAGTARSLPYAATKGGLNAMTRALAVEWADRGVRVNAVAPGWIATDMSADLQANAEFAESFVLSKVPMRRFGQPGEIASAVRYLLSDEASFVTGHVLVSDGGFLAG